MPDPTDITLPELGRRLDRFQEDTRLAFVELRTEIRGMTFVPLAVFEAEKRAIFDRMKQLADDQAEYERKQRQFGQLLLSSFIFPVIVGIIIGVVLAVGGGK